jgi:predicted naringenin-chalcone synthase
MPSNAPTSGCRIGAIGCAVPEFSRDQQYAREFMARHYADRLSSRSLSVLDKVLRHPSIETRYFAVERAEQLLDEDRDERMDRFTRSATDLSAAAARDAIAEAGIATGDLSAVVVNTCTGYICPGVSNYLIDVLDLPSDIRAYDLVGSGCGGAIPNLQLCEGLLQGDPDRPVLSLSVEICTATYEMGDDLSLIVSNAVFGDGAAAAIVWRRPEGLEVLQSRSVHATEFREDIRYVYRDGRLHNQLSASLPRKSAAVVGRLVRDLLAPLGLQPVDVPHWAIHPGGDKVINSLRDELDLTEEQVRPTRETLRDYGNMSSPTAWFVLRRLLGDGVSPGELCIMVAFGAGLSAHACLMRA